MIYFMRAAGTDMVKIGYTKDEASLGRRLKTLQTGHPWLLEIVRTIDGAQWAEGWLHEVFKADHHRGEWFTWNPEMMGIQPPPVPLVWHAKLSDNKRTEVEALIEWLIDVLDQCSDDVDSEPDTDNETDDSDHEPDDQDAEGDADSEPDVDAELTEVLADDGSRQLHLVFSC